MLQLDLALQELSKVTVATAQDELEQPMWPGAVGLRRDRVSLRDGVVDDLQNGLHRAV